MAESTEAMADSSTRNIPIESEDDPFSDQSKMQKVRDVAPGKITDEQIREWFSEEDALKLWNEWKGKKINKAVMQRLAERVFNQPVNKMVESKVLAKPTIDNMRAAVRDRLTAGTETKKRTLEATLPETASSTTESDIRADVTAGDLSKTASTESTQPPEKRLRVDEDETLQGKDKAADEFHAGKEEMTVLTHAEPPVEQLPSSQPIQLTQQPSSQLSQQQTTDQLTQSSQQQQPLSSQQQQFSEERPQ